MKKTKLIGIHGFFLILMLHHNNYTKQNQTDLSEFDNQQNYLCKETISIKKADDKLIDKKEEVVSDIVTQDSFSTGQTRVTVTTKTINGETITTTKICSTKNPSYLTWKNGTLVLTTAAALGLGSWAALQGLHANPAPTLESPATSQVINYQTITDPSHNRQAIMNALEGSDEYSINYNTNNKYTNRNIATGLTPEENTKFAPYAAGALALGAGGLVGKSYGSIITPDSKEIAMSIGKNSTLFSASDGVIHGGVAYINNTDILDGIQHGAINGAVSGAGFGLGSTLAKSTGFNKYGQIGSGIIGSFAIPKPYDHIGTNISTTN